MPASTRETWLLGSAPNSVAAPENSLELLETWACTSSPMMISQSPLSDFSQSFASATRSAVNIFLSISRSILYQGFQWKHLRIYSELTFEILL